MDPEFWSWACIIGFAAICVAPWLRPNKDLTPEQRLARDIGKAAERQREDWAEIQRNWRRFEAALRRHLSEVAELDAKLDHRPQAGTSEDWQRRNWLVWQIRSLAWRCEMPVSVEYDPAMPDYPLLVLVELPTGQVSWHLPLHAPYHVEARGITWDGHSREEKAQRIAAYLAD